MSSAGRARPSRSQAATSFVTVAEDDTRSDIDDDFVVEQSERPSRFGGAASSSSTVPLRARDEFRPPPSPARRTATVTNVERQKSPIDRYTAEQKARYTWNVEVVDEVNARAYKQSVFRKLKNVWGGMTALYYLIFKGSRESQLTAIYGTPALRSTKSFTALSAEAKYKDFVVTTRDGRKDITKMLRSIDVLFTVPQITIDEPEDGSRFTVVPFDKFASDKYYYASLASQLRFTLNETWFVHNKMSSRQIVLRMFDAMFIGLLAWNDVLLYDGSSNPFFKTYRSAVDQNLYQLHDSYIVNLHEDSQFFVNLNESVVVKDQAQADVLLAVQKFDRILNTILDYCTETSRAFEYVRDNYELSSDRRSRPLSTIEIVSGLSRAPDQSFRQEFGAAPGFHEQKVVIANYVLQVASTFRSYMNTKMTGTVETAVSKAIDTLVDRIERFSSTRTLFSTKDSSVSLDEIVALKDKLDKVIIYLLLWSKYNAVASRASSGLRSTDKDKQILLFVHSVFENTFKMDSVEEFNSSAMIRSAPRYQLSEELCKRVILFFEYTKEEFRRGAATE